MDFGFQGVYGSVLTKCFNLFKKKKYWNFLLPKISPNFFWVQNISHRNGSNALVFSSYRVFKTSYGFCGPRATAFPLENCSPGSVEPITGNKFHLCWETKVLEPFPWDMFWTSKNLGGLFGGKKISKYFFWKNILKHFVKTLP